MTYAVLLDRLSAHVRPFFGWIPREQLAKHPPVVEYLDLRDNVATAWHIGRVRYFVERIEAGWIPDPIEIESRVYQSACSHAPVWCGPMITDGHHRYAAAALCSLKTIPATFGGIVTTIDWLTGKRKRIPPEFRL